MARRGAGGWSDEIPTPGDIYLTYDCVCEYMIKNLLIFHGVLSAITAAAPLLYKRSRGVNEFSLFSLFVMYKKIIPSTLFLSLGILQGLGKVWNLCFKLNIFGKKCMLNLIFSTEYQTTSTTTFHHWFKQL